MLKFIDAEAELGLRVLYVRIVATKFIVKYRKEEKV